MRSYYLSSYPQTYSSDQLKYQDRLQEINRYHLNILMIEGIASLGFILGHMLRISMYCHWPWNWPNAEDCNWPVAKIVMDSQKAVILSAPIRPPNSDGYRSQGRDLANHIGWLFMIDTDEDTFRPKPRLYTNLKSPTYLATWSTIKNFSMNCQNMAITYDWQPRTCNFSILMA